MQTRKNTVSRSRDGLVAISVDQYMKDNNIKEIHVFRQEKNISSLKSMVDIRLFPSLVIKQAQFGIGVFANEDISSGSYLSEYSGYMFTTNEREFHQHQNTHVISLGRGSLYALDGRAFQNVPGLSIDDYVSHHTVMQFTNSSLQTNAVDTTGMKSRPVLFDYEDSNNDNKIRFRPFLIANKDIKKGEEILWNYHIK